MFKPNSPIFILIFFLIFTSVACQSNNETSAVESVEPVEHPDHLLIHVVNLSKSKLVFFYKNEKGKNYANHENLKNNLAKDQKKLIFAVNGGMYNRDHTPQGLYIEGGKLLAPLDTVYSGYGNFYLQPNGVFYLTKDQKAGVITTDQFILKENVEYATQSGPMLLIDGKIHAEFRAGSTNLHIRNGVGILPDGRILFVMSKKKINFYDLATYFKNQGCQNALYLDGFVSRTYLPSQNWKQLDGNFGVLIGEVASH